MEKCELEVTPIYKSGDKNDPNNYRPILVLRVDFKSNNNNNDLEVAHPQSGSSSTLFLLLLEFGIVGSWGEGKTGVPGQKPLGAKESTNNKLNPHMASKSGFEPGPHWWEASALTTAPSLAPQVMERAIQSQLVAFLTKTTPYQYINQDSGRNLPPKLPLYILSITS